MMAVALDRNNPGGMNDGAWAKHQPGYAGANGRYAAFTTLTDGVNAMAALLASYIVRGYDTPRKIANRWAPVGDGNDSAAYAKRLAANLGTAIDATLKVIDARKVALAQALVENGDFAKRWSAEQQRLGALLSKKKAA